MRPTYSCLLLKAVRETHFLGTVHNLYQDKKALGSNCLNISRKVTVHLGREGGWVSRVGKRANIFRVSIEITKQLFGMRPIFNE
jgi:hypothetical protein